jgi:hypothetical protein
MQFKIKDEVENTKWQKVFAYCPVYAKNDMGKVLIVWLEHVFRREYATDYGSYYEYRAIAKLLH